MTYGAVTELSPAGSLPEPERMAKKQARIEEILESIQGVGDDIGQINKLNTEENYLVAQFFASLQELQPLMPSIDISVSALPAEVGKIIRAQMDTTGYLRLTFEDGRQRLVNLSEIENRDLMVAVVDDIVPKFKGMVDQMAAEKLQKPSQVQEIPVPEAPMVPVMPAEPELVPAVSIDMPIGLADSAPAEVPKETSSEEAPEVSIAPVLSAEETAKITAVEAETLGYLEMLGNEVFEQAPVSKYFDDWMVNLRQVILSFESSEVIGPDEVFTSEYNQIFGNIEEELAKRQATEADIEVSARRLVENRYLLNKIDEGYAAQTKALIVRGKSAIDYLTRNVQQLETELVEVTQIKVSYRHPRQKIAKDQKQAELTQKLNAAKKRLALAVGNSSVDHRKTNGIDAEYATQTRELIDKRRGAISILAKEVHALEEGLAQIEKVKTANPIKKTALAQKRFDTTQKLVTAKKRLELAEQSSNVEQETLRAEYEKKKQATLGNVQSLEKDIAAKVIDNSAKVRKQVTQALANAVKARIQRKTTPTLMA